MAEIRARIKADEERWEAEAQVPKIQVILSSNQVVDTSGVYIVPCAAVSENEMALLKSAEATPFHSRLSNEDKQSLQDLFGRWIEDGRFIDLYCIALRSRWSENIQKVFWINDRAPRE
ncbi:Hypothetical protein UVM_LOCUS214 [uncultured virus]|nr:Hypothetical protein UVM_LOCUS214 [uncultured virus]